MLTPCEVAVKCVVPVIRAMLAKELTLVYGLKQEETGSLLGITQAAVSQYMRKARGTSLDLERDKEIRDSVKEIATMLHAKDASQREILPKICSVCRIVQRKGIMCAVHKSLEPKLDTKECGICLM